MLDPLTHTCTHTHLHTHMCNKFLGSPSCKSLLSSSSAPYSYIRRVSRCIFRTAFEGAGGDLLRLFLFKPHLAHWADSPSPQTAGLLGCPGKLSLPGLLGGWAGWEGPSPGRGGALRARALQLPTSCPPLCWHCRASPLSPPKEGRGTRPYRRGLLTFTVFCWCTTN